MSLAPGFRLGPYQIVSVVGRGGMGEVYRATDTRLGRTVAVKVLAPHLAGDSDVRARFEREGRVISSLGHPNICTLFDIGRDVLSSGDAIDYLILEYLEGETLDARLARGPLPAEHALRYAIQICDALDAAHRRGLTHRDLKPGNIMITAGGSGSAAQVKLLDFGLAKPRNDIVSLPTDGAQTTPGSDATRVSGPLTAQGTILGTIQYMAPEQIEGREADARTDIWSFGCVLYEMLGGARPFDGATPASLMAAILERAPAPFVGNAATLPPRLREVVQICLEKKPDDRWQSARDLARELRWCATPTTTAVTEAPAIQPRRVSRRAWLYAASGVLAAALLTSAAALSRRPGDAAPDGPPVIVLMDSLHPERVYDEQTRKAGGSNADDLTDVLRDLPVRLVKENTNASWHREYEVLQENPALIVAHRSCFYDATMLGEASRQPSFVNLSWDKFEVFAGLVGHANHGSKILVYSRGGTAPAPEGLDNPFVDPAAPARWVAAMERRFPPLKGRVAAMRVPLDRASFRNPETGGEIRKLVITLLNLPDKS
jgi:serine/threonine protein kinase